MARYTVKKKGLDKYFFLINGYVNYQINILMIQEHVLVDDNPFCTRGGGGMGGRGIGGKCYGTRGQSPQKGFKFGRKFLRIRKNSLTFDIV